jgi:hypothetical protein
LTHAPPETPQVAAAAVLQTVPAQHPLPHDSESQTQVPLAQRWPALHAAPAPQEQAPDDVHPSASAGSQVTHAAPAAPQRDSDRDTQVAPSQQPPGHEVALQTHLPPTHICEAPQAAAPPQLQVPLAEQPSARVASQPTQTAPPLPQVASAGGLQVAPEQQPLGQLVALHPLQCPAVQV